jgi:uncharacterized protein YndB with AHSA1/START domain
MLNAIVVVGVLVVGGLLGFAATRPNAFRVERSTRIAAPPERIFALINDLHRWALWSPYERKDPAMRRTVAGEPSGKGATYAWEGNRDVGAGSMEIIDVEPPSRVTIKLDFTRPFEAHNTAEFTLAPDAGATRVTWAIHGPSPFMSKVMGIFIDIDKMVGSDFETGLANLKALAEGDARVYRDAV